MSSPTNYYKYKNDAKINDDFFKTPLSISNVNNLSDLKIDTQFAQISKKTKDDAFKSKYNNMVGDFFDDAPYSMKIPKYHSTLSNNRDTTTRSTKHKNSKKPLMLNNDTIEKKKNFFINFPSKYDYFDDNKQKSNIIINYKL